MITTIDFINAYFTARRSNVVGDAGATMVEYGLMLALIAVVCIVAVTAIGTAANGLFNGIATSL